MEEHFHSVRVVPQKCTGRMACLRACPTEAIRVRGGRVVFLEDRCIDCGECARACPNQAIVPQTSSFTDFSRFQYTVALPSPALYSQFRKEILPGTILAALKWIGFDDACDVAGASEAATIAISEYLAEYRGPFPLLSPFCPTVVRLIQARHPALVDLLIPVDSPMEIAAREIRYKKMKELGLQRDEIGVIYLTPCAAKMVAIKDPPRKRVSHVDGAIAIADIYHALLSAMTDLNGGDQAGPNMVRGVGLGWPVLGGQLSSLRSESCLAVGGLGDVERILDEIENGKLGDIQYVDCEACEQGCCGGSLTVENPYVARNKILALVARFGSTPSQNRPKIRELYESGYFSLPGKIPSRPSDPLDSDIAKAIEKRRRIQETYEGLPLIDCGACGAPTCLSFAEDVVVGRAALEECVVLAAKRAGAAARQAAGLDSKAQIRLVKGDLV
ncbi:MAG: [Fe-Fe] hydrogenase large subunit C-terminal domain-containing protein [Bryobacteraceae bacterium]